MRKRSSRSWAFYLAVTASSGSCGPYVGGLVVDRWSVIADGAWSLDPGRENTTWCKTIVLAEEMYISAIRPIAAPGTHHVTLSLASDDGEDCTTGGFGKETIYAAGPGAGELRLPPHVAMKLPEGRALYLNLHISNPTSAPLEGVSGIEVVRVEAKTIKEEASFVLAGPDSFTLPPPCERRSCIRVDSRRIKRPSP